MKDWVKLEGDYVAPGGTLCGCVLNVAKKARSRGTFTA